MLYAQMRYAEADVHINIPKMLNSLLMLSFALCVCTAVVYHGGSVLVCLCICVKEYVDPLAIILCKELTVPSNAVLICQRQCWNKPITAKWNSNSQYIITVNAWDMSPVRMALAPLWYYEYIYQFVCSAVCLRIQNHNIADTALSFRTFLCFF